jgi:small subunit ribosomal protein S10
MLKKNKLRITISAYDVKVIEEAIRIIVQQMIQLKKDFSGPIPLPTKRTVITVPISPHKHKDAQEQFERRIHRRLLEIVGASSEDLIKLSKLIIPRTVQLKIKEISA